MGIRLEICLEIVELELRVLSWYWGWNISNCLGIDMIYLFEERGGEGVVFGFVYFGIFGGKCSS
jgi:hypothetical protein